MKREGKTTIQITEETKRRLDKIGNKNDTYEIIILRLLNEVKASK